MLLNLASGLQIVCATAEKINPKDNKKQSQIAADDLLPILIFCGIYLFIYFEKKKVFLKIFFIFFLVIHTDLIRVNLLLKFLDLYGDNVFRNGRLGYCLTTFEGIFSKTLFCFFFFLFFSKKSFFNP